METGFRNFLKGGQSNEHYENFRARKPCRGFIGSADCLNYVLSAREEYSRVFLYPNER